MMILVTVLALAALSTIATIVGVARDGYRRIPTAAIAR